MHSFVINLAKDQDRRQHMESELAKFNLSFEFFEGVDGRTLSDEQRALFIDSQFSQWLLPGEIGCALSHVFLYKKIVADNLDYALVLEDDVQITPEFHQILMGLEAYLNQTKEPTLILLTRCDRVILNGQQALGQHFSLVDYLAGYYAAGYIVNRAAAQSLQDFLLPIWLVADEWEYLRHTEVIKIKAVYPHVVDFDTVSEQSSITMQAKRLSSNSLARRKRLYQMLPLKARVKKVLWQLFIRPFLKLARAAH